MESLILQETELTPLVVFDLQKDFFEISGRSLPEDPVIFYKQISKWVEDFLKEKQNIPFPLHLKFEYINTISSRSLFDMLMMMEAIQQQNNDSRITIHWHYRPQDTDMLEAGQEFADLVNIPFVFEQY